MAAAGSSGSTESPIEELSECEGYADALLSANGHRNAAAADGLDAGNEFHCEGYVVVVGAGRDVPYSYRRYALS